MRDLPIDARDGNGEGEARSPAVLVVRCVLVAVALIAAGLIAHQVRNSADSAAAPPAMTQVALLREPPPPPPEDIPEPEVMEIEETPTLLEEAPEPEPPLPDAADQLGLIGDGVAGADAFGLRSRSGGIDAFMAARNGSGGGNGERAAFQRWGQGVGTLLRNTLEDEDTVRQRNYRIEVQMRFDDTGRVTHCQLASSTGDEQIDALIRDRCGALDAAPPPTDFPQPLRLGVNVRGVR